MHITELDTTDLAALAERLAGAADLVFLDSAMPHAKLGRYSYLAADPYATLVAAHDGATFAGRPLDGDPLTALGDALAAQRAEAHPDLPPFQGGAAGFIAYDYGRRLERLPAPAVDDLGLPDAMLGLYDWVIACDHHRNRAWLISTGAPETEPAAKAARAAARAEDVLARLAR
ncbi:aminodeoxychorismate synthase, component I, partial [Methylopila musalis]